ncbi:AAA family ATPase [Deminuibacter soli]|uniref:AAA family ATPase n=2 Tax=Deminuibacter soli TaxID=2291815 RepID=A0A3E1NK90_9BACT|nr:AAA family ATPase [Deminuibacter soli]
MLQDSTHLLLNEKYHLLCLMHDTAIPALFVCGNDANLLHHPDMIELMQGRQAADAIWQMVVKKKEPATCSIAALRKKFPEVAWLSALQETGAREIMTIPFSNSDSITGFFCFYAMRTGLFSDDKCSLMQWLTAVMGNAMVNVLTHERMEQQLKKISRYKQQIENEHSYLLEENSRATAFSEVIGTGEAMKQVFRMVSQVAGSGSTVLLQGESGTGKELIARAIHRSSDRQHKLMIKLNCAALPPSLIESELFGHEKGSFTGALEKRTGKFELANNSTLFLDEIGELPLELQAKLLRVLQEKEFERVGGTQTIKVNVRIIAATNRNLQKEVEAGRFRPDLFYRLNVFPIVLPPLRDRKEDIPELVQHFMERFAKNAGKPIRKISAQALQHLRTYSFPGNVRELEHLIERSVLLSSGTVLSNIDLPASAIRPAAAEDKDNFTIKTLDEMQRSYILKVVKKCNGRISGIHGAATRLGLPHSTLMSKMKKLKITKEHFVEGK